MSDTIVATSISHDDGPGVTKRVFTDGKWQFDVFQPLDLGHHLPELTIAQASAVADRMATLLMRCKNGQSLVWP